MDSPLMSFTLSRCTLRHRPFSNTRKATMIWYSMIATLQIFTLYPMTTWYSMIATPRIFTMGLSPEPVNEALQAMVLQDYWTADIEAALKAEIDAVCESLRTEEENDTMDETDARETSFMGSQEAEEESQAEFPSEFYGGSSSMTQGPLPWKN
ncbi:hypothetical protein F5B18DRAFT_593739 [Nemania serpens]|nr:hypothetical protein F5B18DRAFT_593739 [Nemania serpens]